MDVQKQVKSNDKREFEGLTADKTSPTMVNLIGV
jgi:hypothetical protein